MLDSPGTIIGVKDPFLFGTWEVSATLKRKTYPYGTQFLPSRSLLEGSPRNRTEREGDMTQYRTRFFSAASTDNGKPSSVVKYLDLEGSQGKSGLQKVIADRAYNAISTSVAYKQLTPVQAVDWDFRKDPTHLSLSYGVGLVTEDMMPLGMRRGEAYITARRSESGFSGDGDGNGQPVFCAAERTRSVLLLPGDVVVSDSESITEYVLLDPDNVHATCRLAVYLTPNPTSREGVLWQQVGGKAVAFFDYELKMTRILQEMPSGEQRGCSQTPSGEVQCV
mmetsp:Transcript_37382/g.87175  ORF Transcript_37382/g.87175 Transcript_37382/m.87175 type:complete len:279 (-) Transcript_37382:42-878(-)|eukprot:CAMPEP_0113300020 /NCGR_PEP_ID=MMETSP0010_2-20120614/1821_1 /TAXON_ID=216773 ORGANISM="Corethron hystrix, Strain 308" /NCGR_SAMPLE_ID=MMETSP0010_2 /ASSEMBLY_ACC=CAM_ASM_000155 /LENGTH=278 /DNA_ID=CAMNT_0000153369 /DNA_START=45 /DNA_END=881 /DNA_ORIENTATION=- /assembly_acc=CAM_ASM_000155